LDNNRADGTFAIVENFERFDQPFGQLPAWKVFATRTSVANPDFETQEAYLDLESKSGTNDVFVDGWR
jgi:hypothetical protein